MCSGLGEGHLCNCLVLGGDFDGFAYVQCSLFICLCDKQNENVTRISNGLPLK